MMSQDNLQGLLMKRSIRGQDTRLRQRQSAAASRGDASSGFLDEEAAGGEIPGRKGVLEVNPEEACPHHHEVERGGPEPADAVDLATLEIADRGKSGLHHGVPIVIEADADEGLVQP